MHEQVKVNVEDYLAGSGSLPQGFAAHLVECQACRDELAELKQQSMLVRVLRSPQDVETRPGFYARVIERIDAQRQSSIWSIFLEPSFGRRLAVASGTLALLMGLYLVGSEPAGSGISAKASGNVILPGEDEPGRQVVFGQDEEGNRGAVLANLAAYRQSPGQ